MGAAQGKHVVSANGNMSANQSGKGDTRRALFEGDSVDRMVALPGQLFLQHADSRSPLDLRKK